MINRIREQIRRFHDDVSGEIPIGPLLVIALIVIPLVLLLVYFRDELVSFFNTAIENLFTKSGEGEEDPTAPNF
jgi:hypothetical protein